MLKQGIIADKEGYFGKFGGNYLPDELKREFNKIYEAFEKAVKDKKFTDELNSLLKHYAGRPSPLYYAKNLSEK